MRSIYISLWKAVLAKCNKTHKRISRQYYQKDNNKVFFTYDLVPRRIKEEDKTENVVSFSPNCNNGKLLVSDFPPRKNNMNHLECHSCSGKIVDCAYNLFRKSNKTVVKLFSMVLTVYDKYQVSLLIKNNRQ